MCALHSLFALYIQLKIQLQVLPINKCNPNPNPYKQDSFLFRRPTPFLGRNVLFPRVVRLSVLVYRIQGRFSFVYFAFTFLSLLG